MKVKEKSQSEVMLRNERFGQPISEKLSKLLRAYTGKYDRSRVARLTGVHTSTIRDVSYGTNSLTENNSKAIVELIRIAIDNCNNSVTDAREAVSELEDILIEKQ